ncbi:MAG TPA: hypothetical protein VHE33_19540 [Acidobacteriaceae bacterium]|nr:hypothetical protein [Acidobacteriaceae bacterium]
MAAVELTEETKQQVERIGSADVVVGIAGAVSPEELVPRAERILQEMGSAVSSLRFVFAWPGRMPENSRPASAENAPLTLLPFPPPPPAEFWAGVSANQRAVLGLAASLNARVCIVLGSDLAALDARAIQLLAYGILERQCGLVMPIYPTAKYDGLINSGVLAPLSRALYGRRVRFPLVFDFAVSGALCASLSRDTPAERGGNGLLWPVTVASTQHAQLAVGQVHIDVHHKPATAGLELSAVLGQLAGSLFQEMDLCASHWQRVRGSLPTPIWGSGGEDLPDGQPVDPQPMLDTFQLGSRNLDEVWRLILPPNSLLELRRLARLAPDQFQMPDALWASIVYDFGLAWRLRTISRGHLLGALTPIYLGWAASYVREVSSLNHAAAEQRLEQLARVWEEKKPYLLSRWRWPDRFHP